MTGQTEQTSLFRAVSESNFPRESVRYGGMTHSPTKKESVVGWIMELLPQLGFGQLLTDPWGQDLNRRSFPIEWMTETPTAYGWRQSQVNTSRVHPCNATNLMDSAEMQFYVDATGDWDGVTREGGVLFLCFHYRSRWVWWLMAIHENIPAIFQVFRCCFSYFKWFLQRLSREKWFWWWCGWIRWFS